ncbi:hypothetical protein AJ80_00324 [Polytolypa hystricis UAMH7299]|uniref:DJ-1/PfpI domain-containing protein n=1 Tax=Polytolypa hystricis (strain UAMH7299) TaxID=1447883 RepID=A0A2B7Z4L9_POLH7|nr:hypothetical protein AJ80_00324 [Polytolypa hystricis UAMH7299]
MKTLRIGVMLETVQFSNIVPIGILGNLSKEYVDAVAHVDPESAQYQGHAPEITRYYMSRSLEPTTLTSSVRILPKVTYDDAPRDLDIVIIGRPLPEMRPEAADRFMKEAWETTRVRMTTCIGSVWLASSGVLKGRKCTTNRGLLPMGKNMYPDTEWLDQRWVVDEKPYSGDGKGELWTSGGAGAGIDMVATYALQNFYPAFVRRLALSALDFDPDTLKGQFYASSR